MLLRGQRQDSNANVGRKLWTHLGPLANLRGGREVKLESSALADPNSRAHARSGSLHVRSPTTFNCSMPLNAYIEAPKQRMAISALIIENRGIMQEDPMVSPARRIDLGNSLKSSIRQTSLPMNLFKM